MVHRIHRSGTRGFTLVELLVVIAIIGVLVSLVFVVAHHVGGAGKQKATEQVLRVLDTALEEYISAKGSYPPAVVLDPRDAPNATSKHVIPVFDGRNFSYMPPSGNPEFINSVGLFMLQCKEVPAAEAQFKNIDAKLVREYDPDVADAGSPSFTQQPQLLTAFDGWGKPIRYVHPAFKGNIVRDINASPPAAADMMTLMPQPSGRIYGISQVRRAGGVFSTGSSPADGGPFDADHGSPQGNRPYFYSCGPDGDPSWVPAGGTDPNPRENDNIYTVRPKFQKK